jgi:RNA polymerase sigma-70 factor (ECF subfamily)
MIYSVAMDYLSLEEQGGERSDEELLALSVNHPALFALLVRRYEGAFLRKAQGIIRDAHEAEDIVQEAFTKIYLNAKKFKVVEGAQFSSWGYRILINTALTHYAKKKKGWEREAQLDEEIWALIPDKNLKQFEKKELADLVASVLSRMPAPMARALSSFFIDGKTQEEIAREESLSVGAVKTRVHRAKAEFKRIFETISPK